MTARDYAVQRWEPPGERARCLEVRLVLEGSAFTLATMSFSSDWGDRAQRGVTWRGSFEETAERIVCRAERARTVDILYDHDGLGDYVSNERRTEPSGEVFTFEKTGGALRCPVDYEGFLGAALSPGVEPPRKLFDDAW